MNAIDFPISDLVAGYVTHFHFEGDAFGIRTSDGRVCNARLAPNTFAEMIRNLGGAFIDCTPQMRDLLADGQFVFAYGIHYPEPAKPFEAKHLVFVGRNPGEYLFEAPDWWVRQIRELGDFYLAAQFGADAIDYANYRTHLSADGVRGRDYRQEADTISRLVYGFASAYNLTGDDRYLEAAERGTQYLRDHFRAVDAAEDIAYWYHAIDVKDGRERKILASQFGDDYNAIPAYEQIYALAGPVQTYRLTGDPAIWEDARRTLNLFERYFKDAERGGYFSHVDPISFDPRHPSLAFDRARKNWNSVGDHAPAYLINLYLATARPELLDMLAYCADMIEEHFPDFEESAFVQEKFHEDWSKDQQWGWQQDRAVVGHNLKIAWNLTRIHNARPDGRYEALARRIAALMPAHGMDRQRGGWYDVVERRLGDGETVHRFAWHDRKAWWQQEQGILAYQILFGTFSDPDYLRYHRESSAFYNAWFLDHDSGGIYFNVLASGLPYLMGTEREKGSHSMSGYHSFELCFLAQVYTNLLISKQPLDLYYAPLPNAFPDNLLRVAPDLLPPGSIELAEVAIDGQPYADFDRATLTVRLPASPHRLRVRARVVPTAGLDHFAARAELRGDTVHVTAQGDLDARAVPAFRDALAGIGAATRLVVDFSGLTRLDPRGARALAFALQALGIDADVFLVGVTGQPREVLEREEVLEEVTLLGSLADLPATQPA
jgi:mannose/cellobiose epimerase-like protein (N-acyl-D-glucosamine 2-epimerase family)/anti-anti-sigma regulatory factor